jgi:hypothetical protein
MRFLLKNLIMVLGQSFWARILMRFFILGKKLCEVLGLETHRDSCPRTSLTFLGENFNEFLIPGKILNEFLGKDLNEFLFQFFVRKVILARSKNQAEFSIGIFKMFLYCSFLKFHAVKLTFQQFIPNVW